MSAGALQHGLHDPRPPLVGKGSKGSTHGWSCDPWGQGVSAALLESVISGPAPRSTLLLLCSTPPLSTAPMYGVSWIGEGERSHTLEQESPWQII